MQLSGAWQRGQLSAAGGGFLSEVLNQHETDTLQHHDLFPHPSNQLSDLVQRLYKTRIHHNPAKSVMAHAIGWSREDLEAPQVIDSSPGGMLHPVHLQSHQHHQTSSQPTGQERSQEWQDSPTPPPPAKSPIPVSLSQARAPGWQPKILGLRRATFFLTVSNILLAIGLVVLGVVQNNVLKNGGVASTGSEAQASCPR